MPEGKVLTETITLLDKHFDIKSLRQADIEVDKVSLGILKKMLSDRLREMIDYEFDNFVNALYRIDISEQKVKAILSDQPLDRATELIAELIIDRQIEKVATRSKYSSGGGEMIFEI